MNKIYCYDRYAQLKLVAVLAGGALLSALILVAWSPADERTVVQQLPRVVVSGKSLATLAAEGRVEQLPPVLVQGRGTAGLDGRQFAQGEGAANER